MNIKDLLEHEPSEAIIIEIFDKLCDKCQNGERVEKLTEPEKVIYFNQVFEVEMNNGGMGQFFFNSSGDYTVETYNSLIAIGAKKTSVILQKGINLFPKKTVPHCHEERQEILEEIEDFVEDTLDELDEMFYAYEDDLNTLNLNFIKRNVDSFIL